jgi:hypothetical protein
MKYFELAPFELRLTADVITRALQSGSNGARERLETNEHDGQTKESNA